MPKKRHSSPKSSPSGATVSREVYSDDNEASSESDAADEGHTDQVDDDEEIEEDEAFNSEDEELYGDFFRRDDKASSEDGEHDTESDDEDGDEEESDNEAPKEQDPILAALDSHIAQQKKQKKRKQPAQSAEDEESEQEDEEQNRQQLLQKLGLQGREDHENGESLHQRKSNYFLSVRDESLPENEFNVGTDANNQNTEVSINSLLSSLQGQGNYSDLKKKLEGLTKGQAALKGRPSTVVEERATRKAAYNYTAQEISKWQGIVRANRNAPHLSYTHENRKALPNEVKVPLTSAALASKFEAETGLEQEVAAALDSAGMQHEGAAVQEEENELEEKSVSKEEIKQRQKQLAKLKALLFYDEKKKQRANKIKSKGYRKMKKRQRLREADKELERLKKVDPEKAAQLEEDEALARATERMTQKKQNASKIARRILALSSGTSGKLSKEEAEGQLRQEQALKERMGVSGNESSENNDESDSETASSEDEEEDSDIARMRKMKQKILKDAGLDKSGNPLQEEDNVGQLTKATGISGLKFMQKAFEKQHNQTQQEALQQAEELDKEIRRSKGEQLTDDDSDSEGEDNHQAQGRRTFPGGTDTYQGGSSISSLRTHNQRSHTSKTSDVLTVGLDDSQKVAAQNRSHVDGFVDNPWMDVSQNRRTSKRKTDARNGNTELQQTWKQGNMKIDIDTGLKKLNDLHATDTNRKTASKKRKLPGDAGNGQPKYSDQEELIRRAFAVAPTYTEADLEEEKRQTTKASKEKIDEGSKGWGEWTGMGITKFPEGAKIPRNKKRKLKQEQKSKEQQKEEKIKEEMKSRKDKSLSHVYISEKRDRKLAAHQVERPPYPYTSREHYETALQTPLGKEWNTLSTVKDLNQPEEVSRAGEVIEPIKYVNIKRKQQGRPKGVTPTMGKVGNMLGTHVIGGSK